MGFDNIKTVALSDSPEIVYIQEPKPKIQKKPTLKQTHVLPKPKSYTSEA